MIKGMLLAAFLIIQADGSETEVVFENLDQCEGGLIVFEQVFNRTNATPCYVQLYDETGDALYRSPKKKTVRFEDIVKAEKEMH